MPAKTVKPINCLNDNLSYSFVGPSRGGDDFLVE